MEAVLLCILSGALDDIVFDQCMDGHGKCGGDLIQNTIN